MPRGQYERKKGPRFSAAERIARDVERFWATVDRSGECWLWTGCKTRKGYGHFQGQTSSGRHWRAHRFSYALANGHVPAYLMVLHRCDTPACVNPLHLFLGTAKSNAEDCKAKGRSWFGSRNGRAKLTEADVLVIRASDESDAVLAKRYGVYATTINAARSGKKWPHLPGARIEQQSRRNDGL